jgi:hypothetical protein
VRPNTRFLHVCIPCSGFNSLLSVITCTGHLACGDRCGDLAHVT